MKSPGRPTSLDIHWVHSTQEAFLSLPVFGLSQSGLSRNLYGCTASEHRSNIVRRPCKRSTFCKPSPLHLRHPLGHLLLSCLCIPQIQTSLTSSTVLPDWWARSVNWQQTLAQLLEFCFWETTSTSCYLVEVFWVQNSQISIQSAIFQDLLMDAP